MKESDRVREKRKSDREGRRKVGTGAGTRLGQNGTLQAIGGQGIPFGPLKATHSLGLSAPFPTAKSAKGIWHCQSRDFPLSIRASLFTVL